MLQKDGYELFTGGKPKRGIGDGAFFNKAPGAKSSGRLDVEVLVVGADEAIRPEFDNVIADAARLGNDIKTTFFGESGTKSSTPTTNPSTAVTPTSNEENTENVKYRKTTGKGTRFQNTVVPDFEIKDTIVPESKASEIYDKLDKKFQDDWQKQIKKDN